MALCLAACSDQPEVDHRPNCNVCHQPRDESGDPHGIEEAHPAFPLSCVRCHGGNDRVCDGTLGGTEFEPTCDGEWVYDKTQAHVQPPAGTPAYIKNLPARALDELDQDYLRFINPGDFRVLDQTCGQCHPDISARVQRSTMTHTSGELTVARYRAQMQTETTGLFGSSDIDDPNYDPTDACTSPELKRFAPEHPPAEPTVGEAQDQYMAKACMRCHLNDFGENRFQGDFRSSGCTACHMEYADDGLSRSADPRINKQTAPHPKKHTLTASPSIEQCTHCHYRGGRIGISFQGYRESGGPGLNPEAGVVLGRALHGHDATYYLTDEDSTNDYDETPPDVHFEAGMHCVDCHTEIDIHGSGHLVADTQCAVTTECTDCHGDARSRATLDPARPNLTEEDGRLWLLTKVSNQKLEVPQVADSIDPNHAAYNPRAEESMGIHDGKSHTDTLECYTCHSGWIPSCYGCHVQLDMSRDKAYQTTGDETPGAPTGDRRWVVLNDLVLLWNSDGKLAPSMPAERLFMSVKVEDGTSDSGTRDLYRSKPRSFNMPDGRTIAGFGQRAFNPHTTRRRSQFMLCDRCHSVGSVESPENQALLDLTHGFGTQRFMQDGCDVSNQDDSCDPESDSTTYPLDAIIDAEGRPLVVVGHPEPSVSRVLTLEEIERMRAILVDPEATTTPAKEDPYTDPHWPYFTPVE